jgi:hypothetical protein
LIKLCGSEDITYIKIWPIVNSGERLSNSEIKLNIKSSNPKNIKIEKEK